MIWSRITADVKQIIDSGRQRIIIAIDGVDASGKTHFAQKLKRQFESTGIKTQVVSIDDFHHRKEIRYQKGRNSPIGFYEDSYNYETFLAETIQPFKDFKPKIKTKHFDLEEDKEIHEFINAEVFQVLIIEGIFLHRKELYKNWDYSLFLQIPLEQSLDRNVLRTMMVSKKYSEEELKRRYFQRYIKGQEIYLQQEEPHTKADLIIDNTEFLYPKIKEIQKPLR